MLPLNKLYYEYYQVFVKCVYRYNWHGDVMQYKIREYVQISKLKKTLYFETKQHISI